VNCRPLRPSRTDHDFYDKVLADGSTAGTKISFGVSETDLIPPSLWPRIWRRQLRLRVKSEFRQGLVQAVTSHPSLRPDALNANRMVAKAIQAVFVDGLAFRRVPE